MVLSCLKLLDRLGVEYKFLNGEATGDFAHNPEPIAANLTGIMDEVAKGGYDLGIVVDPDVDRLAFIQEDGKMYGEEYTRHSGRLYPRACKG